MATSIFDASVIAGSGDSAITTATPGVLWKHVRNAHYQGASARWVENNSTNTFFQARQRIPPPYVAGGVTAYLGFLDWHPTNGIHLRLSLQDDDQGTAAGPQLTTFALNNLGLAFHASSGATHKWRFSDLMALDATEPFEWRVTPNPSAAIRSALNANPGQAAIVNIADPNVLWDTLEVRHVAQGSHSVFDAGVVFGFMDPDVSMATPGAVWSYTNNVSRGGVSAVTLVSGGSFPATQRIPPVYIVGGVNAFVTSLSINIPNNAITLFLQPTATDTSGDVGPQLTDAAETNLALAFRAADGTVAKARLADLVISDTTEPYVWTYTATQALITALNASGAQSVLLDLSSDNVDYDGLTLRSLSPFSLTLGQTVYRNAFLGQTRVNTAYLGSTRVS